MPGAAGAVYLLRASRNRAEQVIAWGTMADDAGANIAPDNCLALRRDRTHVVMDASQGMLYQHAGVNSRRRRARPAFRYRRKARNWECWRCAAKTPAISHH